MANQSTNSITLTQLLDAREQRSKIQKQYIEKYHCPVICLTCLSVGSVKRTERTLFVAKKGQEAVLSTFDCIVDSCFVDEITGYYAIFACNEQANRLKQLCVQIEQTHPLGRLFDLDVLDLLGKPISRTALGFKQRRCLLCEKDAAICTRSAAHDRQLIQQQIDKIITTYKEEN